MDRRTVKVYAAEARRYRDEREVTAPKRARALARAAARGHPRVDLGCGPGLATGLLGTPVIALDAAREMLPLAREQSPGALPVQADLEALPFRPRSVGAAWGSKCYQHLPRERLPLALAELHWCLEVDAPAGLVMFVGDGERRTTGVGGDDFPGRLFSLWQADEVVDLLTGAGFRIETVADEKHHLFIGVRRVRTLPDTAGPGMRLLVCGLNPSLYAADAGVGFARPGNRFWPAAREAGLVTRDRDPRHALVHHGIGMTDLVKRATARAGELQPDEYRSGMERIERLVGWLRPGAVCMVGLTGWRTAVDAHAMPGLQPGRLADAPVYLMPSTSGVNAHARLPELMEHLRAAVAHGQERVSRSRPRSARPRRRASSPPRPAR